MQKIGASSEFCAHALNSALFSVILNLVVRIRISFRGSAFHGNTDPHFQNLFVLQGIERRLIGPLALAEHRMPTLGRKSAYHTTCGKWRFLGRLSPYHENR